MLDSIHFIQLKAQIEKLKASDSILEKELKSFESSSVRDDLKTFRLKRERNELHKKIRSLEVHLVPDIIA